MSVKRPATTDLNHDNWDQEDPNEHEEMGSFKPASKDVIEKRVIRTAKRRSHTQNTISPMGSQGSSDGPKKTVFSGFGGFNKTQPTSFDFLANLTNGNRNSSPSASKNDTTLPSTVFSNTALSSNPSNGIFGAQLTTESTSKPMFGIPSTHTSPSSMFGSTTTNTASSIFTASKADSPSKTSPFNIPLTSTSNDANKASDVKITTAGPQVSSTMFGMPPTNNTSKLFTDSAKPTTFGNSSISPTKTAQSNSGSLFTSGSSSDKVGTSSDKVVKTTEKQDEKKLTYYTKLKGLNLSVSDWIKKHVEETPLCILSPIFKDYEKYLKEIQEEYNGESKKSEDKPLTNDSAISIQNNTTSTKPTGFSLGSNTKLPTPQSTAFTLGSNTKLSTPQSTVFTLGSNTKLATEQSTTFSLGSNTKVSTPQSTAFTLGSNTKLATEPSTGFSLGSNTKLSSLENTTGQTELDQTATTGFGIVPSLPQTTSAPSSSLFSTTSNTSLNGAAPFSFGIAKSTTSPSGAEETKKIGFGMASSTSSTTSPFSTNTSGAAPFSFGIGKPFSFNANVQKTQTTASETNNENEDEDTPPKVEYKPIVEENCVYEKRCKVFVKKDGNFADKGVGTLYIKKIDDNGKHQLLVRANTTLGNVLINLILVSAIPVQRMGKNNVMMVCIPTPDSKPPPVPMLIRVKTSEEADELLETLNKYKT